MFYGMKKHGHNAVKGAIMQKNRLLKKHLILRMDYVCILKSCNAN